jgi:hypothetical protein
MFCAPRPVFCDIEGGRSCFHVLRSRTHFRRYLGRRVQFSCFVFPDLFSAVPTASGLVFMFCVPGQIFSSRASGLIFLFCAPGPFFDGTYSVMSRFRRYRRRQVLFSKLASWNIHIEVLIGQFYNRRNHV